MAPRGGSPDGSINSIFEILNQRRPPQKFPVCVARQHYTRAHAQNWKDTSANPEEQPDRLGSGTNPAEEPEGGSGCYPNPEDVW